MSLLTFANLKTCGGVLMCSGGLPQPHHRLMRCLSVGRTGCLFSRAWMQVYFMCMHASALSIPLAWSVNYNFKSVFDIVFLIGYCRRSIYTFVIFPVCSHSLMGFLCNNVVLLQDLLWKKAYSSSVWPWFAEAYSDKGCPQLYWQICKCICSHFVTLSRFWTPLCGCAKSTYSIYVCTVM